MSSTPVHKLFMVYKCIYTWAGNGVFYYTPKNKYSDQEVFILKELLSLPLSYLSISEASIVQHPCPHPPTPTVKGTAKSRSLSIHVNHFGNRNLNML